MIDRISLRDAMQSPMWMMVYASEPQRNIDVRMTYGDLFQIYELIPDDKKKTIPDYRSGD